MSLLKHLEGQTLHPPALIIRRPMCGLGAMRRLGKRIRLFCVQFSTCFLQKKFPLPRRGPRTCEEKRYPVKGEDDDSSGHPARFMDRTSPIRVAWVCRGPTDIRCRGRRNVETEVLDLVGPAWDTIFEEKDTDALCCSSGKATAIPSRFSGEGGI